MSHDAMSHAGYRAVCCPIRQLTTQQIEQWQQLEDRALEPNPFLSPLFVLPAVRYLTPQTQVIVLLILRAGTAGEQLVGVGVFEVCRRTRLLPLRHLKAYQGPGNSFQTGVLVDEECAEHSLDVMFRFLRSQPSRWHNVEFDLRSRGSQQGDLMEQVAARHGFLWHGWDVERPAIHPQSADRCQPDQYLSKNRRKKVRRSWRALQEQGPTEFRVLRNEQADAAAADTFLSLEDQGWKAAEGQSLKSDPQTSRFFQEMWMNFARHHRIVFTELSIDGQAVGSTSNLIAGDVAVAYKSGWDPRFAHLGVGALQEVELVRSAPGELSDLSLVDSGTSGHSWMESLWPERRRMATGVFAGTRSGSLTVRTMLHTTLRSRLKDARPATSS